MKKWLYILLIFGSLSAQELAKPLGFDDQNFLSLSKENRELGVQKGQQERQKLDRWLSPYSKGSILKVIAFFGAIPLFWFLLHKIKGVTAKKAPFIPAKKARSDTVAATLEDYRKKVQEALARQGATPSMTQEELIDCLKRGGAKEEVIQKVSSLFEISTLALYAHATIDKRGCQLADRLTKEIVTSLNAP